MKNSTKKAVAKAVGTLGLLGCSVMNSPLAMAAASDWYGGFSAGQSRAEVDDNRIRSELLGSGLTTTSIGDNERDLAYKIFGGYKFNRNFALEGGFFNLGVFGFDATTSPAGTLSGSVKMRGLNLDAVALLPLGEKLSAFGRLGGLYGYSRTSFTGTGAVVVADAHNTKRAGNYKAGLGLQYDFTESLALRGEFERYRLNDGVSNRGDIDMASLGLVFKFGEKPAPVARVVPTPPPRAVVPTPVVTPIPTPVPTPVLVIVPVPPTRTAEYCSILDIQFEINQDEIQLEEKEKLAVVGTFMTKYPDTTAVIEGHSDNVGNSADNLRLSQHRADSVVSYLVETFHIAPTRLTAVGYGETRPIADNSTEDGKRANRRIGALIACATDIEGLKVIPARITMAMLVEFDPLKAEVKPEYRSELAKVAKFLKANPTVTAIVQGHTGNLQATSQLAMEISQRRAQNVVNYLVDELGVERARLTAEGFGQTRRFAYNTSTEGQQENRRVNIIFNYTK